MKSRPSMEMRFLLLRRTESATGEMFTDVKKYRSKTDYTSVSEDESLISEDTEPIVENHTGDSTGDSVPSRPVRNRKLPAHLKDYEQNNLYSYIVEV